MGDQTTDSRPIFREEALLYHAGTVQAAPERLGLSGWVRPAFSALVAAAASASIALAVASVEETATGPAVVAADGLVTVVLPAAAAERLGSSVVLRVADRTLRATSVDVRGPSVVVRGPAGGLPPGPAGRAEVPLGRVKLRDLLVPHAGEADGP